MPQQITFPLLASINNGINLAFNDQLWAAKSIYKQFSFDASSTGDSEVYPRLDMISGLREWLGDRVVKSLSLSTFSIRNRTFEETIGIGREQIEDDKYGLLTPVAAQLGENAGRLPDLLVAALLKAGNATAIYDGQNFFDTAHPNFAADGSAATALNYVAGASPAWFLIDSSRVLKPVIFQSRRQFQVIPKFSMTDPQVFWNKEFEWGVDGRCNVGFGIWQLAYMSKAALTHDNLVAARTTMASYRRPDGSPMGIMPDLLVVDSSNFPTAKSLYESQYQPGAAQLTPNQVRGMFRPLENPWLN